VEDFPIRHATIDDALELSGMARAAFCETFHHYQPDALAEFLNTHCGLSAFKEALRAPNITILIASAEQKIIGYTKFGASRLPKIADFRPEFELHQLYVLKAWQGRKIGARLMQGVIGAGYDSKAPAIHLGVWEHNVRAQEFYKRHGFTKVGDYDYLPIGDVTDHEWIMEKSLIRQ